MVRRDAGGGFCMRWGCSVLDWLFQDGAWVFGLPASVGTVLFILKFLLMALGVDHVVDADVGFSDPGDVAMHVGDKLGGKDVSVSRRWISLQGFIVLFMVGGWCGVVLFREVQWPVWSSAAVALVVGVGAMWAFGQVFEQMYKLQESGNVSIDAAVGGQGQVYVGVPAGGAGLGQVSVVINQKQRLYAARTQGEALSRGTTVAVTGTAGANTLVVERAKTS